MAVVSLINRRDHWRLPWRSSQLSRVGVLIVRSLVLNIAIIHLLLFYRWERLKNKVGLLLRPHGLFLPGLVFRHLWPSVNIPKRLRIQNLVRVVVEYYRAHLHFTSPGSVIRGRTFRICSEESIEGCLSCVRSLRFDRGISVMNGCYRLGFIHLKMDKVLLFFVAGRSSRWIEIFRKWRQESWRCMEVCRLSDNRILRSSCVVYLRILRELMSQTRIFLEHRRIVLLAVCRCTKSWIQGKSDLMVVPALLNLRHDSSGWQSRRWRESYGIRLGQGINLLHLYCVIWM